MGKPRWVEQGASSFWSFCVDYLERPVGAGASDSIAGRRGKIDYKEILAAAEFNLFSQLRDLRKQIAQAEAVPVYTVFTNEQLAQMVRTKAITKAALEQIAGVGVLGRFFTWVRYPVWNESSGFTGLYQ
jgi:superfamily II DNA helicase RecQ